MSLLRASIPISQHATVDFELKCLKLLIRRLESALTTQGTELKILQRLYYKNKNQHHGSLFWRNVVEIRRYAKSLESSNLSKALNTLRCTFYNSETPNANLMKSSWTHFPKEKGLYLALGGFQKAEILMHKTSEVCIRAYESFNCSLQSAAFLQLLLIFVAISSRMCAISKELKDIVQQIVASITRLLSIHKKLDMSRLATGEATNALPDSFLAEEGTPTTEAQNVDQRKFSGLDPAHTKDTLSISLTTPSTIGQGSLSKIQKPQPIRKSSAPRKKKSRAPRNEIDDIFGV